MKMVGIVKMKNPDESYWQWVTSKHKEKALTCASPTTTQPRFGFVFLVLSPLALTCHQTVFTVRAQKPCSSLLNRCISSFRNHMHRLGFWRHRRKTAPRVHRKSGRVREWEWITAGWDCAVSWHGTTEGKRQCDLVEQRRSSPTLNHSPCHPTGAGKAWESLALEKSCNFLRDPS